METQSLKGKTWFFLVGLGILIWKLAFFFFFRQMYVILWWNSTLAGQAETSTKAVSSASFAPMQNQYKWCKFGWIFWFSHIQDIHGTLNHDLMSFRDGFILNRSSKRNTLRWPQSLWVICSTLLSLLFAGAISRKKVHNPQNAFCEIWALTEDGP